MVDRLLNIEECQDLTAKELAVQIRIRKELMKVMVGELYPAMLCDEILKLLDLQDRRLSEEAN